MSIVFISYSHTDSSYADEIAAALEELRIEYFRDVKNIEWGDPISDTVRQGLQSASAIIVVVSPGSLESQWVAYEVGFGTGTGKRVLPYLTQQALDVPGFMSDLSYVKSVEEVRDYFTKKPDWRMSQITGTPGERPRAATLNDIGSRPALAATAAPIVQLPVDVLRQAGEMTGLKRQLLLNLREFDQGKRIEPTGDRNATQCSVYRVLADEELVKTIDADSGVTIVTLTNRGWKVAAAIDAIETGLDT